MSSNAAKFYSILTFRSSLALLCKKDKNGYASCPKDVCSVFEKLSFDDIWEMNTRLREIGNLRLIKIRVQNSCQNLSSADGFRLIICCNKVLRTVAFLNIYPKRGKYGQLNQPKEETARQLTTYAKSLKDGDLVEHNVKDELKQIEKDANINSSSTEQRQPS
jgi:hypothetical protein